MKPLKIFETNHNSHIDEKFHQLDLGNIGNVVYWAKFFEITKNVPGDIVECGIGRGRSMLILCALNYLFDRNEGGQRQIFGYDSFKGFPQPSKEDKSFRNPKKDMIAYCGTGGVWHDWQAAMVSRDGGVPKFNEDLIKIFDYNDSDGLEQIFEDNPNKIAAIVLEHTQFEEPNNDFLQKVRKIANTHDSLLILDEIVTGFRFDLAGAQKYFDIKGDLVCFGKGMANGLPLSAITGPSEFMRIFDDLWVSSTNNSETLSLAGTKAVITEMKEKNTISHCWRIGKILFDGWNEIAEKNNINAKMNGYPIRMDLRCFDNSSVESLPMKSLILQEMVKQNVFMSILGVSYICYSHSKQDIQKTLQSFENVCNFINNKVQNNNYQKYLDGPLPKTIWSMKLPSTKKHN